MRNWRKFGVEFKKKVVEEIRSGVLSKAQAIRQYDLSSGLIHRWMDQYEHGKLENEPTHQGSLENKISELERKVGQQAMEIDLLKKVRTHYQKTLNEKSSVAIPAGVSSKGAKS